MNWLTPSLVEDIEQQFPAANEIDAPNHNQHDYDTSFMKIAILFPPGRNFAGLGYCKSVLSKE
jgi:hypothetical protein